MYRMFYEDEEELEQEDQPTQKRTSKRTSINKAKLPAIFKLVTGWESGAVNLDYGGGQYDIQTAYLADLGVENLIYDPYNRGASHNQQVLKRVRNLGGADTVTCSNVLNVIEEEDARMHVLQNIKKYLKPGGVVYITVYEGSGDGVSTMPSEDSFQLNRKTADYLEEIEQVFSSVTRKGKLIIARP